MFNKFGLSVDVSLLKERITSGNFLTVFTGTQEPNSAKEKNKTKYAVMSAILSVMRGHNSNLSPNEQQCSLNSCKKSVGAR